MASAELKKLFKKRSSIKSSIDAIDNYVNKFNKDVHSIRQLQIRLTSLNQFVSDFNITQQGIRDLDLGYEEEEEERLLFEDKNFTLLALMEDLISEANTTSFQNNSHTSNGSSGESLRLPTIEPPTFNGNLDDWPSYIDTFNSLFHNNKQLDDVRRLHYLKSGLSGPAADIVKNFAITAENYSVAYGELVRQYDNKGLTIQTHIRSLLMTPKVNVPSAVELRNLHNHVASHVRTLKALRQPVQHWDAWLVTRK